MYTMLLSIKKLYIAECIWGKEVDTAMVNGVKEEVRRIKVILLTIAGKSQEYKQFKISILCIVFTFKPPQE